MGVVRGQVNGSATSGPSLSISLPTMACFQAMLWWSELLTSYIEELAAGTLSTSSSMLSVCSFAFSSVRCADLVCHRNLKFSRAMLRIDVELWIITTQLAWVYFCRLLRLTCPPY